MIKLFLSKMANRKIKSLEDEVENLKGQLCKSFEVYVPLKADHGEASWQSVEEVQGVRIGRMGAIEFALGEDDIAIGEGFHHIDVNRRLGTLGATTYYLNGDFAAICRHS